MNRITVLILAVLCTLGVAAQNWSAAVEKAMGNKAFSSASATVLLDSTGVSVTDNGSGSFTIHKVVRIQDNKGALAHRVLVYDYDPLTASARFDKVTVTSSNGDVREIDPATACDYAAPARAIYWGARQIMIELGALQPGDIVDYTIAKNNTAEVGNKTIYMRITTPDDVVLQKQASDVFQFEDSKIAFSARKSFEYTGEELSDAIYYTVTETLWEGDYRVDLFVDGHLIGQQYFTLAK